MFVIVEQYITWPNVARTVLLVKIFFGNVPHKRNCDWKHD